jgi:hypothetical protein
VSPPVSASLRLTPISPTTCHILPSTLRMLNKSSRSTDWSRTSSAAGGKRLVSSFHGASGYHTAPVPKSLGRGRPVSLEPRLAHPKLSPFDMNSRLAACDPCRRSKLACDHEQPVCSRCQSRGKASACVYRDSPFKRKSRRDSEPPDRVRGAKAVSEGTLPYVSLSYQVNPQSCRVAIAADAI